MFGFGKKKRAEEAEKAAIDKAVAEEVEETNVEVEELKEEENSPEVIKVRPRQTAPTTLKKSPPKTSKTTSTWARCASSCSTA